MSYMTLQEKQQAALQEIADAYKYFVRNGVGDLHELLRKYCIEWSIDEMEDFCGGDDDNVIDFLLAGDFGQPTIIEWVGDKITCNEKPVISLGVSGCHYGKPLFLMDFFDARDQQKAQILREIADKIESIQ